MNKVYYPHPDLYDHFTDEERLRWAKNLRETKIEQCFDTMSYGNGTACCLHIWEIYESNGGEWFYADDKSTPHNLENPTHLKSEYLPEELNLAICESGASYSASYLNDGKSFTFNEIADILEGKEVVKNV